MEEVSATEAARRFSELLDAVEHRRESFTVTRHGRAVARVTPTSGASGEALADLLRKHPPDPGWADDLRSLRELLVVEERPWSR